MTRKGDERRTVGGRYLHYYMEDKRFLLALGEDADKVTNTPGVSVLRRVRNVVVVEAATSEAVRLAHEGEHVHVYRSSTQALQALSVFER